MQFGYKSLSDIFLKPIVANYENVLSNSFVKFSYCIDISRSEMY